MAVLAKQLASISPTNPPTDPDPRLVILISSLLLMVFPLLSGLALLLLRKFSREKYDKTAPYCPFRRTWAVLSPILTKMKQVRHRNRGIRARAKALSKSTSSGVSQGSQSVTADHSTITWNWLTRRPKENHHRTSANENRKSFRPWRKSKSISRQDVECYRARDSNVSSPCRHLDEQQSADEGTSGFFLPLQHLVSTVSVQQSYKPCFHPSWHRDQISLPCSTFNFHPIYRPCTSSRPYNYNTPTTARNSTSFIDRVKLYTPTFIATWFPSKSKISGTSTDLDRVMGIFMANGTIVRGTNLRRSIAQGSLRTWWDGLGQERSEYQLDS